jgi:signal transduction histidine kinase
LLLVLANVVASLVMVAMAAFALAAAHSDVSFRQGYVFPPIRELGITLETHAFALRGLVDNRPLDELEQARLHVAGIRDFTERYQREWQTFDLHDANALRMYAELKSVGQLGLLDQEQGAMEHLESAVRTLEHSTGLDGSRPASAPLRSADAVAVREALLALNRVNNGELEASWEASEAAQSGRLLLVMMIGGLAFVASPLLGLAVRRAIAPRIERLVDKVRRFRELGVDEPIDERGGDEIATLAHALDVSFHAIAERDKERQEFLAVASHELRTPLASMKAFADIVLRKPGDPAALKRALEVIGRQSVRLARLSDDLLFAARAREKTLPFAPAPADLAALTRRVIDDVQMASGGRSFPLEVEGDTHLLFDALLMEHGIWSMLAYLVSISPERTPVEIQIEGSGGRVRLMARVRELAEKLPADVDRLLEPFGVPQYEGRPQTIRHTGIGLHLCREIARLHGAVFRVERHDAGLEFAFEFSR